MRSTWRKVCAGIVVGMFAALGAAPALAQSMTSGGRSLGGYGASMSADNPAMGMSGPVIPYGGNFGGFMPYRMGGGGDLSFRTRGASTLGSNRVSFSLSPMSAMGSMTGGMGSGLGGGSRPFATAGSQGSLGLGAGMSTGGRMATMPGTGVMPPSFGYPFRQPPSLSAPAAVGMGMSM